MVRRPNPNITRTIELVIDTEQRTMYEDNSEDLVLFELGPRGIGFTAQHILSSSAGKRGEMQLFHEKIAGFDVYIDIRLPKPPNLDDLINTALDIGYPFSTRLDELNVNRQVLALREVQQMMRKEPGTRKYVVGYSINKDTLALTIHLRQK